MKFKAAPLDGRLKRDTTALVVILLLLAAYFVFRAIKISSYSHWFLALFPLLIIILAYLYQPVSYEIENGFLKMNQRIKSQSIKISEIKSWEHFIDLKSFETKGSGKFFGYVGKPEENEYWCATNKHKILKIITSKEVFFISPSEIEEFKIHLKRN